MKHRRERPWLLVGMLGAVVAFLVAAACSGPQDPTPTPAVSGAPRISFAVEEVNLGRVPLDYEVHYEFKFTNVGSEPLTIRNVVVSVLEGC